MIDFCLKILGRKTVHTKQKVSRPVDTRLRHHCQLQATAFLVAKNLLGTALSLVLLLAEVRKLVRL
jgi:hypothetical protein